MPDYFSTMAIQSLARVLPNWRHWANRAAELPILKEAVYPFPNVKPKFLGTVVQNYRPRSGSPAKAFQTWIDRINEIVSSVLFPQLEKAGMTLPEYFYRQQNIEDYCLVTIPDFNSLIAKSQDHNTPVYALTPEQLEQGGSVLDTSLVLYPL